MTLRTLSQILAELMVLNTVFLTVLLMNRIVYLNILENQIEEEEEEEEECFKLY